MPTAVRYEQVESTNFVRDDKCVMRSPSSGDLKKQIAIGNRLWLVAFFGILVIAGYLIYSLGRQDSASDLRNISALNALRPAAFDSQKYTAAADEIHTRLKSAGIAQSWVRFTDERQVQVELPSSTSRAVVSDVISVVRNVSRSRLSLSKPVIRTYFAAIPGKGSRSLAPFTEGK